MYYVCAIFVHTGFGGLYIFIVIEDDMYTILPIASLKFVVCTEMALKFCENSK